MTCASMNCGYYWQEEGEEFARCHYPDDGTKAPCEYDDDEDYEDFDDDYDECGFDPYEGCYTYDC